MLIPNNSSSERRNSHNQTFDRSNFLVGHSFFSLVTRLSTKKKNSPFAFLTAQILAGNDFTTLSASLTSPWCGIWCDAILRASTMQYRTFSFTLYYALLCLRLYCKLLTSPASIGHLFYSFNDNRIIWPDLAHWPFILLCSKKNLLVVWEAQPSAKLDYVFMAAEQFLTWFFGVQVTLDRELYKQDFYMFPDCTGAGSNKLNWCNRTS